MMEIPTTTMPAPILAPLHDAAMALSKRGWSNVTMVPPTATQSLMPAEPTVLISAVEMVFVTQVRPVTMEILITPMLAKTTVPPQPVGMVLYKRVSNNAMTVL